VQHCGGDPTLGVGGAGSGKGEGPEGAWCCGQHMCISPGARLSPALLLLSAPTDIWSLGITAIEVRCGGLRRSRVCCVCAGMRQAAG
jgi:hypothetical protein